MHAMFAKATTFNQPLDSWNVEKVENMNGMFFGASAFNQPLQNWRPTHLKENRYMFFEASSFSQSLNTWGDKAPKKKDFHTDIMDFLKQSNGLVLTKK
ncbi:DUF285 domain-containing protein [Helicobacter sp. faydin-H23]|nr:DUF285 domain-containing protein [Helicobacter kayseriensis]